MLRRFYSTAGKNPKVFFDVSQGGKSVGRIVMEVCMVSPLQLIARELSRLHCEKHFGHIFPTCWIERNLFWSHFSERSCEINYSCCLTVVCGRAALQGQGTKDCWELPCSVHRWANLDVVRVVANGLSIINYCMITGEKGVGKSGKPLHYKGSLFHRVIPQVWLLIYFLSFFVFHFCQQFCLLFNTFFWSCALLPNQTVHDPRRWLHSFQCMHGLLSMEVGLFDRLTDWLIGCCTMKQCSSGYGRRINLWHQVRWWELRSQAHQPWSDLILPVPVSEVTAWPLTNSLCNVLLNFVRLSLYGQRWSQHQWVIPSLPEYELRENIKEEEEKGRFVCLLTWLPLCVCVCVCDEWQVAVLHHYGAHSLAGQQARRLWQSGWRHGCREADRDDKDGQKRQAHRGCGHRRVWRAPWWREQVKQNKTKRERKGTFEREVRERREREREERRERESDMDTWCPAKSKAPVWWGFIFRDDDGDGDGAVLFILQFSHKE